MTTPEIDPEGTCAKATRHLQRCLSEEGQRLAADGFFDQALVTLFRAYSLLPGATPVLHSISDVYHAKGDHESAMACRRAVIPEQAEERYFNARCTKKRIIAARRASNCQHKKTHKPQRHTLQTPKSNGNPETRPEFRVKKTESRGSFVSDMRDASFWFDGFNTVVADSRQQILKEHIKGSVHLVSDTARLWPEHHIDATVCFIDARSSAIYYHWMIDVLPKFAVIQAAGLKLTDIDYFVVRCSTGFQRYTLQHLGIPAAKLLEPCKAGFTHCKRLVVPYLKHDRGDRFYNGLGLGMATWVPVWLTSTFIESPDTRRKNIYISRSGRGTRTIIEEESLVRQLATRGFEILCLEELNVTEQANLMASADIVVAAHGAGLTNIAFCTPGTTIIEIFGAYVVPCYWALSELSKLDYHAYFVDAQDNVTDVPSSPKRNLLSMNERRNQSIDLDVNAFITYFDKVTMPAEEVAAVNA